MTSAPGTRAAGHRGGGADLGLLVAVPVEDDAPARQPGIRPQHQPAAVDRLDEQLLDLPDALGHRRQVGQQRGVLVAEHQHARRFAAHDGRTRCGVPVQRGDQCRGLVLGVVEHPLGHARPAAAPTAREVDPPPGPFQQLDARAADVRFGERGEGIGEPGDRAELPARRGRPAPEPAEQVEPLELRQRPGRGDAEGAFGEPAQGADPARQVRQRRGGRAEPVERADRGEHPGAQRGSVDGVVVRERLGLERRHVHAHRALALARLAHQAEVEDLVQALVTERGVRVRFGQCLDQCVGPPPVESSSFFVAM